MPSSVPVVHRYRQSFMQLAMWPLLVPFTPAASFNGPAGSWVE